MTAADTMPMGINGRRQRLAAGSGDVIRRMNGSR